MKRVLFVLLVAIGVSALSGSAWACSLAPEGYFLASDRFEAAPEGPFVIAVDNYYGYEIRISPTLVVTDSAGTDIAGTLSLVARDDGRPFMIWTPDSPLDSALTYTVDVDFGQETQAGITAATLVPNPQIDSLTATLTGVRAIESVSTATQECCTTGSNCFQDTCGGSGELECESCWATSFTYPVRPIANVEVVSVPTGRYIMEVVHVAPDDARELLSTQLLLKPDTLSAQGASLPESVSTPICLEVAAIDVVTETRSVIGTDCIEDGDIELNPRDQVPGEAPDTCDPGSFFEVDETGKETPISTPTQKEDGGCTAAGTGAVSWFLLIVGGFARRRRRSN